MIPSGWSALPPLSDLGSWPPPSDASGPSKASSAVAFEFGPASLVVPDASSPAVVSAAALKKSRYLYCCSPQVVFSALLAVQPLDQEVVEDGGPDSPCFLTWDDRDLLLPQYP